MTKKNITKNVKSVETISTADHAEPRMREEFAVFCNLLHGWFKQPERFEQFAARCAENAKVAVVVAIEKGIV